MTEIKANIWSPEFDDSWRIIPINTMIKANGRLIMGKGLAKEALVKYPDLDLAFALELRSRRGFQNLALVSLHKGSYVRLIGFPTKYRWRGNSDLGLIEQGLITLKNLLPFFKGERFACPRLGCGLGNLDWESQVKPLMEKYFKDDDNFFGVSL